MITQKAYVLGALNAAVFFEKNKSKVLYGDTAFISELDDYTWSHFCAIKPEYKQVTFDTVEKLRVQTNTEAKKYEALQLSLELMDTSLSDEYKYGASKLLADLLNGDRKLILFVKNRLYSTPLPALFSPEQALKKLLPNFHRADKLYLNLKEKTILFSHFYTLFKLNLDLELEKQDLLDQSLTDSGCYAKFTIALYQLSKKKYDTAAIEAFKQMKELSITYSYNLFYEIEQLLKQNYSVILSEDIILPIAKKEIASKAIDEEDEILRLIEAHNLTLQKDHDNKRSKRGKAKKVIKFIPNIIEVVDELKEWAIKQQNDEGFFHEFKDLVKKQLHSSKPEQLCKTCCDIAAYFTQIDRFDLAKKLLSYAKRINAEDPVIYSQEAELYNKLGDLKNSLKLYDFAIEKFNNNEVAYNGKAETLRDMGRFEEALQVYNEAIAKFLDNEFAWNGKAETLKDIGKFDEALKFYNETIEKFPHNVVAYSGKAETLKDMGEFDEALKLYNETIEKFEGDVVLYNGKVSTLREMGKMEEALQQCEVTIQKFNDDLYAYCGKAEILKELGKSDDALSLYENILRYNSGNRVAQIGRFRLLLENDRLESYLDILVKSNYKSFDDYINLHVYSMYLIKKRHWTKAFRMIKKGLKSSYFKIRLLFKGVASYFRILKREYKDALYYFDQTTLNKPFENLLATHAFAASNNINEAKNILHSLDYIKKPVFRTTLDYLSERYMLNGFEKTGKPKEELDNLIIEGEMKVLLQV